MPSSAVEPEPAERRISVTSETVIGQDRAHFRFEVLRRSGVYSLRFQAGKNGGNTNEGD